MSPFRTRGRPLAFLVAPIQLQTNWTPSWKGRMLRNRYAKSTTVMACSCFMCLQLGILTDRMVLAVSIKEGAEAMLHGNPEGLTVLTL
jgi:hypothetical protein